jgi:peptidoglycan/LPS O-acetylase OafA/YrhL
MSGYLMEKSFSRFINLSHSPSLSFYKDRCLKLFPQYLIILAISSTLLCIYGPSEKIWFLNQTISFEKIIYNILLLPTNYIFSPLIIHPILPHPIIPPAWSLATEFHFYLLLPFIFALSRRLFLLLLLTALSIQITSFFVSTPQFNADSFAYRYIFGVLPIFLMGYLYSKDGSFISKHSLWIAYVFLYLLSLLIPDFITQARANEVLIGAVVSLPLLKLVINVSVENKYLGWLNLQLGNLAYPIFICHCLGFYLLEKIANYPPEPTSKYIALAIIVTLVIAIPLSLTQQYIERYRFNARGFGSIRTTLKD